MCGISVQMFIKEHLLSLSLLVLLPLKSENTVKTEEAFILCNTLNK
jgi:hypothetical protein